MQKRAHREEEDVAVWDEVGPAGFSLPVGSRRLPLCLGQMFALVTFGDCAICVSSFPASEMKAPGAPVQ